MKIAAAFSIPFLVVMAMAEGAEPVFQDSFRGKVAEGWRWIREDGASWRVTPDALEIRVQPGNMWGPENSAKNVLVRRLPEAVKEGAVITVTVQNRPTEQYEQVDLVWYYDDSHMVKIGQELVDGQLSIVMGREQGDRTRTIAIIPLQAQKVQLRFEQEGKQIAGYFRPEGSGEWQKAGECDLPVKGEPKVAIQCYQGPAEAEHWAKIADFSIAPLKE